jgi:hypothetical protein
MGHYVAVAVAGNVFDALFFLNQTDEITELSFFIVDYLSINFGSMAL